MMNRFGPSLFASCLLLCTFCDQKPETRPSAQTASNRQLPPVQSATTNPQTSCTSDSVEEAAHLGSVVVDDLTVRATRDRGEIKPGGDAPIDVWITTPDGTPPKDTIVRFWIGHEDARGALKAKADIEDPAEPSHWHTHVEVPESLSPTARLWVEIDTRGRPLRVVSFELKA